MPIQLNDDTIVIISSSGTYTIDRSYDDTDVISLLSTSNITLLGGEGLNVDGNINFTSDLTKDGVVFSSYNDTDVISLLSTSNITLSNDGNVGIGNTLPITTIDVVGSINISEGSRYQVDGSDLSFNDVIGTLSVEKGGTGTTNIDDLKTLLGIGTSSSEYEITDISPVFFNLTTTGKVDINLIEYINPMTFTIYGKNFDRNVEIKLCLYNNTNSLIDEKYINTIYHDSTIQIRVNTRYIPITDIVNVSYFKLMMYDKNYPDKKIYSSDIYKDENDPTWLYDNEYGAIYNIDNGFEFTINDIDTNNILSYELVTGAYLIPNLSFNSQTGKISGIPEIFDTDINLTINAKSGSISLPTRDYTLHILSEPIIYTDDQKLLVSNSFDLLAQSKANDIQDADTSITWSLIQNEDSSNITINADNTISVVDLTLLSEGGKNITLKVIDAYGYSSTKIINIKRTPIIFYSAGYNENGELGLGNNNDYVQNTILYAIFDNDIMITQIACGDNHTIFLASDNKVYGVGLNTSKQLGIENIIDLTIKEIEYFSSNSITITQIACGANHTIFLASDNKVYSCGNNTYGQLCLGFNSDSTLPQEITYFSYLYITITQIACGSNHTIFLASDNKVYSCGNNEFGQLGLENFNNQSTPREVNYFTDYVITITQIACGANHTIFLASDNKVYSCGNNDFGQLGLNSTEVKITEPTEIAFFTNNVITITQIACGADYTIFLANDNKVYSCGNNSNGQLGINSLIEKNEPTEIAFFTDNEITITQIACGSSHTYILTSDDDFYGFGNNSNQQLCIELAENQKEPKNITILSTKNITQIDCGKDGTIAYKSLPTWITSNEVKLSSNTFTLEALNYSYTTTTISYSLDLNGNNGITLNSNQVEVDNLDLLGESGKNIIFTATDTYGYSTKIINIKKESEKFHDIYGTGKNTSGQLGNGEDFLNKKKSDLVNFSSISNYENININHVSCGFYHTFAIDTEKKVYGFGYNNTYALSFVSGYLTQSDYNYPVVIPDLTDKDIIQIAAGFKHSIFLGRDGKVYGVGGYDEFQLGFGVSSLAYQESVKEITWFTEENRDIQIKQIACGKFHTLFLDTNGIVYGTGNANEGQLGNPDAAPSGDNKFVSEITWFNNNGRNIEIKQVATGEDHTIFLATDGKVYSCGNNEYRQLGLNSTDVKMTEPTEITFFTDNKITITQIACGSKHTMFLAAVGIVYGIGLNTYGQLGIDTFNTPEAPDADPKKIEFFYDKTITQIACGSNHTMFLASDGKVYGVGGNTEGQLGNDLDYDNKKIPDIVYLSDIVNIKQIACGESHTMFLNLQ